MKKRTAEEAILTLARVLADLFESTEPEEGKEEIDVALRELGHDPGTLESRRERLMAQALERAKLRDG